MRNIILKSNQTDQEQDTSSKRFDRECGTGRIASSAAIAAAGGFPITVCCPVRNILHAVLTTIISGTSAGAYGIVSTIRLDVLSGIVAVAGPGADGKGRSSCR